MSIHDGHRQRIKKRFRMEGLDHFEEVHVLELLLCYCIPRIDTNPLAHALLEKFGTLSQVLEASVEELEKVPGVGENVSTFLTLTTAVSRYYMVNRSASATILNTPMQCGKFLLPYFVGRRNETVCLLCLDAKCKVICCREVGEGSVNVAAVPIRKIVEMAIGVNATSVILAHNHPGGLALPSHADLQTTKRVARALHSVEIILSDHIIVSEDEFVSLAESGKSWMDEIYAEML